MAKDTVNAKVLFNHGVTLANDAATLEGKASTMRFHMTVAFAVSRVAAVNGWGGEDAYAVSIADAAFEEWNKAQSYSKGYASKVRKARKLLAVALEKQHATLCDALKGETDAANAVSLYIKRLDASGIRNMDNVVTTYGETKAPKVTDTAANSDGASETDVHNVNPDAEQDNHAETEKTPLERMLEAIAKYGPDMSEDDVNTAIIALVELNGDTVRFEETDTEGEAIAA